MESDCQRELDAGEQEHIHEAPSSPHLAGIPPGSKRCRMTVRIGTDTLARQPLPFTRQTVTVDRIDRSWQGWKPDSSSCSTKALLFPISKTFPSPDTAYQEAPPNIHVLHRRNHQELRNRIDRP